MVQQRYNKEYPKKTDKEIEVRSNAVVITHMPPMPQN